MKFQLSPVTKGLIVSAAGGLILLHGSGFPLSPVDAQQKSPIQEELEKLYQQDGRQAPDMSVRSLPRQTIDGRVFQEAGDPSQLPVATRRGGEGPKYAPSQSSANRLSAPPRKKKSFLDRMMFWKKDEPAPRRVIQPTPRPSRTAETTPPTDPFQQLNRNTAARKGLPTAPLAPPADTPYQRPPSLQGAPRGDSNRQPVTLEVPMNDSDGVPQPAPEWNRGSQPLRQPVAQPQQNRNPLISAEPLKGKLPVIIPKVPPAPADSDAPNRVIVTPGKSFDSNDKAAALPESDELNAPGLQLTPKSNPFAESEDSAPADPEPLKGPRPMPAEATPAPAIADEPETASEEPAVVDQPPVTEDPMPAAKLPNLDELPDEPLPIVPEEEKPVAEQPPVGDKNFPDPFTEISEQEADAARKDLTIPDIRMNDAPAAEEESIEPSDESVVPQLPEIPAVEKSPEDAGQPALEEENPFSGLKLDSADSAVPPLGLEPGAAPMLPPDVESGDSEKGLEGPSATPSLPDIDPTFDDDFKLPVKKDASDKPLPDQPILEKIPDSPLPELPAADDGDISWEEEQARREAKLALIAAREGETGMKGFCIVELRDNRDLVDAVPAFRSTYNLRTYHFSSLEAKIEFDKAPRKYVPAYDGNDPILLSTESEEREGSLDFALWFKGRLYLFTSRENLEVFQADPVLYSEN